MKTIVLKFSGPLQSWGVGSNFENRDTARHPTKSAVIGLVSGALGYRRNETSKIQKLNDLSFGVRIEQQGTVMKDFHIAKSKMQSYVTNRYYLQDAVFIVLISHEDSDWVDMIANALARPIFPPFMGRRCSPVGSDYLQGVVDRDLLSILKTYPWQASEWYKKSLCTGKQNNIVLDAFIDAYLLDDTKPPIYQRDRVESFDLMNRNHGFRPVRTLQVELKVKENFKDTEHDAFKYIGGV